MAFSTTGTMSPASPCSPTKSAARFTKGAPLRHRSARRGVGGVLTALVLLWGPGGLGAAAAEPEEGQLVGPEPAEPEEGQLAGPPEEASIEKGTVLRAGKDEVTVLLDMENFLELALLESDPAPGTEAAEENQEGYASQDRVRLFKEQNSVPPLGLNRFNFKQNVLVEESRGHVKNWMIRFCHDWFEPCWRLTSTFRSQAWAWEQRLNSDSLQQLTVRFAEVDCSVDKVLCNEQGVESFPSVVRYKAGKQTAVWRGRGSIKDLTTYANWLEKQLLPSEPSEGSGKETNAGPVESSDDAKLEVAQELAFEAKLAGATLISLIFFGQFYVLYRQLAPETTGKIEAFTGLLHKMPERPEEQGPVRGSDAACTAAVPGLVSSSSGEPGAAGRHPDRALEQAAASSSSVRIEDEEQLLRRHVALEEPEIEL